MSGMPDGGLADLDPYQYEVLLSAVEGTFLIEMRDPHADGSAWDPNRDLLLVIEATARGDALLAQRNEDTPA
jgi:hypothetical protein